MRFSSEKPRENTANLARILGYRLLSKYKGTDDELNLVRPLGRDYPRFHIYLKEKDGNLDFNLHLDQKRPSYLKQPKHSGEYDSDLVLGEKQRIQKILSSLL